MVKNIPTLQVFRGIAALLVVFHHAIPSIVYYHDFHFTAVEIFGYVGKYGVDFFFVLSGFIITYSYNTKIKEKKWISTFIKSRIIRIYVPLLPLSVVMLFLYKWLPHLSNANREVSLLTSFTLIPHGHSALSVAWTLSHELLFYLLFTINFYSQKFFRFLSIFWATLILLHMGLKNNQSTYLVNFFLSPYNIEFLMGFLVARIYLNKFPVARLANYFLLIGAAVSFLYFILTSYYEIKFLINFAFAVFISCLLLTILGKEIKCNRILLWLGNISFSIYLVHNPIQMVIIRLSSKILPNINIALLLFIVILMVVLVSYLYQQLFEKKLTAFFKRQFL